MTRLRIVLATLLLVGLARPAYAQTDTPKPTAEERAIVLLEGSSAAAESATFLRSVRDHLGDLGVRIATARPAEAPRSLVATVRAAREAAVRERAECTTWVDVARNGDIILYLLEPRTPHLWTRRLRARDEPSQAATIERVGLIARWAVAALIEGRQIEMDPDPETVAIATVEAPPAPEPAPPPAPKPRALPEQQPRGWLSASYTGSSFSGDAPWESGVGLSVRWHIASGFFVGAGYRFLLPVVVESAAASARISRHPLELSLGYRVGRDSFFWYAEVGGILDYSVRTTTAVAPAYVAEPEAGRVAPGVAPRLGAAWLLAPRIWLTAAAGIDVFFNNASYIVAGGPAGDSARPWVARPRGDLGMAADLW